MLEKAISKSESITAVSSKESWLDLPSLHIIIKKEEESLTVGHCLDFNIHAHSQDEDFNKAKVKIFTRICDMSIIKVFFHLKTNSLEKLYENSVPLSQGWDEFLKDQREKRIQRLQQSYNNFIEQEQKFLSEISERIISNYLANGHEQKIREIEKKIKGISENESYDIHEKASKLSLMLPIFEITEEREKVA